MAEKSKVGEVRLENVRLSFAALFTPETNTNDEGKVTARYKANFLIDPETKQGTKNDTKIKAAIKAVRIEKWGDDYPKLKADRLAYRDGDEETWDGYEGMWYVSSSRAEKLGPPVVVDRNPKVRLTEKSGKPYSGCHVNAIVRFWAQDDPKFGKRVNCTLEAVQFYEDGEAFGAGQVDAEEVFDSFDDDDGDEAGDDDDLV